MAAGSGKMSYNLWAYYLLFLTFNYENTKRIHKISSVCKYCRRSAAVMMMRMRAEFVGPLVRHGRHLQTIEQRLRIVLYVYKV
jgi:hypothetical protein